MIGGKKEPFLDVVESDLNARNFGKVGVVRQTGRQSSIFGLYSPSLSLSLFRSPIKRDANSSVSCLNRNSENVTVCVRVC